VLRAWAAIEKVKVHNLTSLLTPYYPLAKDLVEAQATIFTCYPMDVPPAVRAGMFKYDPDHEVSYRRISAPNLSPDEKLSARVLCPPVLPGGYAPVKSLANELWCIETRVLEVHNDQLELPDVYHRWASEFLLRLFPEAGMLSPIQVEEVLEAQNRPAQRVRNDLAKTRLAPYLAASTILTKIRAFQKGEVYGALKDPRNISTLPAEHCLLYSTFTMAMSKHLKRFRWYAFGMHPDNVAQRVKQMCLQGDQCIETDFSRFDGTHSQALYDLELAGLLRAFKPDLHPLIRKLHDAMVGAPARTAHRLKYDLGGSRVTGAADTSIHNTINNAYLAFCMYKNMGLLSDQAWDALGLYGGDDGLSIDLTKEIAEKTAKDLKLRLKVSCVPAGAPHCMLGRKYPNPRGTPGHMADLPRQLAKINIYASRDPVEARHVLYNRARSWMVTDCTTPVLGAWARMIIRLLTRDHSDLTYDPQYESYLVREFGQSACTLSHAEGMKMAVADLGVSQTTIEEYERYLEQLDRLEDLVPIKLCPRDYVPGIQVGNTLHWRVGEKVEVAPQVAPSDILTQPISASRPSGAAAPVGLQAKAEAPKRELEGKAKQTHQAGQRIRICWYTQSECKRKHCAFQHVAVPRGPHLRTEETKPVTTPRPKLDRSNMPCWGGASCTRTRQSGDPCPFAHPVVIRPRPEQLPRPTTSPATTEMKPIVPPGCDEKPVDGDQQYHPPLRSVPVVVVSEYKTPIARAIAGPAVAVPPRVEVRPEAIVVVDRVNPDVIISIGHEKPD
jgi:hypothetical protein